MSFIRPDAQAALLKWRELLIGAGIILLGLYWTAQSGLIQWIGAAVTILGGLLCYTGLQRARFRTGKGGLGVVSLDEREISYFGPISGGVVSLNDLSMLTLDGASKPAVWVLHQPGQQDVAIPVNAEGADQLFEAFATLPGIRTEHMLTTLKKAPNQPVVIWAKPAPQLH